ncbi:hypothetical protein FOMPIDRAFT_1045282 [Fomitopsis schrenkii]|uniref:Uncharacterized protein n=1 Tax=Fomitopsis schrenkii TaxID=2126942 RepID=S8EJB9_FOMSC|nr:hypothetical protein FOMPIDRAFT_1045282 [Fomitopsis schrenkii]
MSSSSSPPASSTSSPAASSTSATSSGGSPEPSSLYLFTFLATLFLLLFVSAAIVLRSFILRRRFRRRIEEAIAAGVYIPPPFGTPPGPCRILERPKLWDVYLAPTSKKGWSETLPLAAKTVAPKPGEPGDSAPSLHEDNPNASASRLALLRRPFARRRAPSTSPVSSPNPSQPTEASQQDELQRAKELQVAVMIMMPNPHRPAYGRNSASISLKGKERNVSGEWDEEEDGIPDVVLGLAQVSQRTAMPSSPEH